MMTATPQTIELNLRDSTPFASCFEVFERFTRNLETPGGRILVLLLLVFAGYVGAAWGAHSAEQLAATALITLLFVLARNPHSQGFLAGLLSLFRPPH
jgi:hypothetical protein